MSAPITFPAAKSGERSAHANVIIRATLIDSQSSINTFNNILEEAVTTRGTQGQSLSYEISQSMVEMTKMRFDTSEMEKMMPGLVEEFGESKGMLMRGESSFHGDSWSSVLGSMGVIASQNFQIYVNGGEDQDPDMRLGQCGISCRRVVSVTVELSILGGVQVRQEGDFRILSLEEGRLNLKETIKQLGLPFNRLIHSLEQYKWVLLMVAQRVMGF